MLKIYVHYFYYPLTFSIWLIIYSSLPHHRVDFTDFQQNKYSQAVTHPSTNLAQWYGRRQDK